MSHRLARVRDERGRVAGIEELGGEMVEMIVELPHLAATALPGEFAQLRVAGAREPLLRRPFSVAWTEGSLCHFVFARVGEGTRSLAALRPGDEVESLGPLGTGFDLAADGSRALCISGGLGCAPFPLLARELRRRGAEVTVISGARSADRLYPAERFRRGDATIDVIETTDDGSRGRAGTVVDLAAAQTMTGTAVYACGPNPMLAALATALAAAGTPPEHAAASLEAPMACGFGTCLGCVLPVHATGGGSQWALCCSDGPVMQMTRVDWPRLLELPAADVA